MKRIQVVQIGILLSSFFFVPMVSQGCDPLPVLLYPADEIYKEKGWPIPELPEDAIALIDGEYISKAGYQKWLYEKIGFTPRLRATFLLNRTLRILLQDQGVDTERELNFIMENLFDFELCSNVFTNQTEWKTEWTRLDAYNAQESSDYKSTNRLRIHNTYLQILYLMQNWDEIHPAILAKFEVDAGCLTVEGDDPEVTRLMKMNNAYQIFQRYSDLITAHITKTIPSKENPDMSEHTQEYKDWLHEYYSTVFLVENYLGMLVSDKNAEKKDIRISEEVAAAEFQKRLDVYRQRVEGFNQSLEESAVPLDVSPVYADFIMQEVRDDLRKSRAHRNENPLKPYEVTKKFYDQFGYMGQRCQVKEIFKWIRVQRGISVSSGHADYVASEEARIRKELNEVRNSILAEGVEHFPVYAITENQDRMRQNNCGLMNSIDVFGEEYAATLQALSLHEVSPVLKGPWNTLDLFWVAEENEKGRIYYMISRNLPLMTGYDDVAYRSDIECTRAALEDLKRSIEGGESIDTLAEVHSDSFIRSGVDISTRYQDGYGFRFAKEVATIPVGGLKIIASQEGLHLVQVLSRDVTPFTEEIKNQIIKQYTEELANQQDRYVIVSKMFSEVNPYFKSTQTY